MADGRGASTRVIGVRPALGRLAGTEADAARAVADRVPLDERIAATRPEVDPVLRQARVAPKPLYFIVVNSPAAGSMNIDAARIAVGHHRATCVGELDFRAADDAVVG